ncbi:hypothetical protein K3495_g3600 [Podosphaera aphanis]|nr:hypothetical protein K3495_g3600 [Podosphaera aphanis]
MKHAQQARVPGGTLVNYAPSVARNDEQMIRRAASGNQVRLNRTDIRFGHATAPREVPRLSDPEEVRPSGEISQSRGRDEEKESSDEKASAL